MSGKSQNDSGIETLSGIDGALLNLETAATPMHVGSLHLFDTPADYHGDFFAAVRRTLKQRMVPVLCRRLAALPLNLANPAWLQGRIDLDQHIRLVRLPAPGTWAQLETVVADLHAELLDRSRPLWMMYVLDGLGSGEKAYYIKIHHAMLDGQAGVALANILFDASPNPPDRPRAARPAARKNRQPGMLALAAAAFRHDATQYIKLIRALPGVVRTLAGIALNASGKTRGTQGTGAGAGAADATNFSELRRSISFGPHTMLNVAITPERGFATTAVPFAGLKAIAAANQATVNDVVLALCSGALRRYLKRNGSIPRKSLIASMPISLREHGNTDFRTQATLSLVSLASNIANPHKRLRAIRDSASATKAVARRAKSIIPTDFPLIGVPWILGALTSLYGRTSVVNTLPLLANVLISNVPGPPVPLYVDGLRMSGYWPLSIVEHGIGLNITLLSYCDDLCVGFTAARCAVPDARQLAEDFLGAYAELKQRVQPLPTARRRPAGRKGAAASRLVGVAAKTSASDKIAAKKATVKKAGLAKTRAAKPPVKPKLPGQPAVTAATGSRTTRARPTVSAK
jgi:WS/DGAT/MGAT family acyltransferase